MGEVLDVAGDADDDGVVVDAPEDGGDDVGREVAHEVGQREVVAALDEGGRDPLHGSQVELVDEVADTAGIGAGGDVGHEVDAEVLGVLAAALGVDEADEAGAQDRPEPPLPDGGGEADRDVLAGGHHPVEALVVGGVQGVADLPAEVAERVDREPGEELDLRGVDLEDAGQLGQGSLELDGASDRGCRPRAAAHRNSTALTGPRRRRGMWPMPPSMASSRALA